MQAKRTGSIMLIIASVIYLLNPGAGLFELLPDNIPLLGNVDESLAFYLLISSVSYLRTGQFNLIQGLKEFRNKSKEPQ